MTAALQMLDLRRRAENETLRGLIFVGDSLARSMLESGKPELAILWQLAVAGISANERFIVPLVTTGNAMADRLAESKTITGCGAASAWRNTLERMDR